MKKISASPIWLDGHGAEVVDDGDPRFGADVSPNRGVVERLLWDITSIDIYFDKIREYWAKRLGITGPQWMILSALTNLDQGEGVPVKDVSAKLHVDPSFVTTQSKILEQNGLLRRKISKADARVVRMSLSLRAYREIANLSAKQEMLHEFIFADFDGRALRDVSEQFALLKERVGKAVLRLAADL
jgi:DNA-binding MarR family transcriptional regulator